MPKVDRPELRILLLLIALPLVFDKILFFENSILGSEYLYYSWTILSFVVCFATIFYKLGHSFRYDKSNRQILYALLAFLAVSGLSMGMGFVAGNDVFYVIGDFLKFSLFAMIVAVFLMTDLSLRDVYTLIAWILLFYFLTLLKDSLLYLYIVNPEKLNRPLSVYLLPAISLLYIAAWKEIRQWPGAVFCGACCIVLFPIVAILSDSLAILASFLIISVLFLAFAALRNKRLRVAVIRSTCAAAVLVILVAFTNWSGLIDLGTGPIEFDSASGWEVGDIADAEVGGYTAGKLASLKRSKSLLDTVVLLSGDRALFLYAAATQFGDGWGPALFGTGLGGEVILPFWQLSAFLQFVQQDERQHFIEMAYPEMFIRSGIVGLTVFILIFVQIARAGFSLYRKETYPSLLVPLMLAIVTYLLVSFIAYADFPKIGVQSPWMIGLIASAVVAEKREKKC